MTGGTMTRARVASVLAVLAVLGVLTTTAATVAAYSRRGGDAGAPTGPGSSTEPSVRAPDGDHAFRGGRFVVGGGARFEVPARRAGWSVQPPDTVLYYLGRDGRPAVGVTGAAVFRAGYCPGEDGSNRAFAGFTRPTTGGPVQAANTALAGAWVDAVSLDEDLAASDPHSPLRTERLVLGDGTPAVRTTSRITVADPGPCGAPEVVFTILSLATGEGPGARVAHLVLVRDAGARGTLAGARVEEILRTARRTAG